MEPLNTGVIGFDEMLKGGIPKEHIVAVLGSPGTGKSTFTLQFIYAGLLKGENCVYLSLEESEDTIVKTASIFGWDLKPYITNKKLVLIRLSTMNIKAAATWVENDLPRLFKSFNVKRLVIDPITLYEMLYESEPLRREHLFNFAEKIREHGITVIMTSETNNINPYNSKMRRIEHSRDIKPYSITKNGIVVHPEAEVFS